MHACIQDMQAVCGMGAHRRMLAVPLVEHRVARKLQQTALCGIVEKGKATNAAATLRGAAAARLDLLAGAVPLEQVIVACDLSDHHHDHKDAQMINYKHT
jgi:hypothetical protein